MTLMISEMIEEDKPRERMKKYGVSSLSNEELIAIVLRSGTKKISVKDLSSTILKEVKKINNLKDLTINKMSKIKGIGEVKAISLLASIELGKRVYEDNNDSRKIKINNTGLVYEMFKYKFISSKQEEFVVIFLDTKKNIIDYETIFIGTIDQSIVHPREIFKKAYLNSASAIICVHNHPSGDVNPSNSDILLTKKIKEVGNTLLIPLLDHLIIGDKSYYSFYENGVLE